MGTNSKDPQTRIAAYMDLSRLCHEKARANATEYGRALASIRADEYERAARRIERRANRGL